MRGGERREKREIHTDEVERGAEGGTPSERAGSPAAPYRRAPSRTRRPLPAEPQAMKKNSATPNDFFSSTPSWRTLITFLSEITLRGERGASP